MTAIPPTTLRAQTTVNRRLDPSYNCFKGPNDDEPLFEL